MAWDMDDGWRLTMAVYLSIASRTALGPAANPSRRPDESTLENESNRTVCPPSGTT